MASSDRLGKGIYELVEIAPGNDVLISFGFVLGVCRSRNGQSSACGCESDDGSDVLKLDLKWIH